MKHDGYNGKVALVFYRGGVVGEDPFDDHSPSAQADPERILLGSSEVPRGVSEVLYAMAIGEEQTAVIPADKAYGRHDPAGVQRYPRAALAGGDRLAVGDVFAWTHPVSGAQVPVRCVDATQDTVVIDFNHLLAGKDLEYWFKLVDVVEA